MDVVWNYRDYRLNHIETPAQSSGSEDLDGLSSSGSEGEDEEAGQISRKTPPAPPSI